MENRLTTAENFAASQVLTEWPDDMTYDELLDAIKDDHPDVIVYCMFENCIPDEIIENIDCMRQCFLASVAHMTEDLREAIKQGDPETIAARLISLENQLGVN